MTLAFVLILLATGLVLLTAGVQVSKQPQGWYQSIKKTWLFITGLAFLLIGFLIALLLMMGKAPQP